jgi:hypothetical protein
MYLSLGRKAKFNLSFGLRVKLRVSYHLVMRRIILLILRLELRITLGLKSGPSAAAFLGVGLRVPFGLETHTHGIFSNGSFIKIRIQSTK